MSHKKALTEQVFILIDTLCAEGMTTVVTSPGSRSTPLALAAEIHPKIKTYIHPDERSAAFFALGLSKKDKKPVGLICTSGTAAANYTPAVAESDLSHIPLVVLTADRPAELRDVGAPQAIVQNNMYQNYVRYFTELPAAEAGHPQDFIIDNKVRQASVFFKGVSRGPVHFNIPIREPLMPDMNRVDLFKKSPVNTSVQTLPEPIEAVSGNILVILGETDEDLSSVETLTYENVTVIADPRQHCRIENSNVITSQDLIFLSLTETSRYHLEKHFDYIVRVGEPLTSKASNQFLKQTKLSQIVISEYANIKTFPKAPDVSYTGTVSSILDALITAGKTDSDHQWLKKVDTGIKSLLKEKMAQYEDEGRYMYEILNHLSPDHTIFLSSSMPIRDYERYNLNNTHKVYANRGANGIDGVVSTALGMAASGEKVTLIIGDVALYHDMNGLLMAKLEMLDINVVVFNNNGGGIFSFLPQYAHKEHFERLFGTPLSLDFEHTASLYDYQYTQVDEVGDITGELLNQNGRNLIEIRTDRELNLESHQSLKNDIIKWVQSID